MTKEQFAQLVLESTDSLYRVSKGILRNDSDCEDAVWEAIGIGFARLSSLRKDKYAKTWLTRILIHECFRILQERKFQADVPEGADVFGSIGSLPEDNSELYEALMTLDEKYRVPIVLFYLEGYSIREISGILRSPENTVKSWLSRGRSRLKEILEEG